jgi:hypothetical protein
MELGYRGEHELDGLSGERRGGEEDMGHGGEGLGQLGTLGFIFSFFYSFLLHLLETWFSLKFKFNHALRVEIDAHQSQNIIQNKYISAWRINPYSHRVLLTIIFWSKIPYWLEGNE